MADTAGDSSGEIVVSVFGRTDVGRTREHNEDTFVVVDLTTDNATLQPEVRQHVLGPKGTMFMVADGMGGAAAGEIASAMAVEVVLSEMRANWVLQEESDSELFARALKRATAAANAQIHAFAAAHTEYRGMGTTATIAGLLGDTLYLAQVGDSRAYIIREGMARQITKDQSLMQKLIEAGEMTEEEAAQSERRNIILQALGPEPVIKVDLTHQSVRRGDTLVLCSDGLSGQVTKDEIARVVNAEPDLVNVCKTLIDRANEAGGPDNITVIAARFGGAGLAPAATSDEVGHRVFPLPETGQVPAVADEVPASRRTTVRTSAPTAADLEVFPPNLVTPPSGTASITPNMDVIEARRARGRTLMLALLVAFIAVTVWFIVDTARDIYRAPAQHAADSARADSARRDSLRREGAARARRDSITRATTPDTSRPAADSVRAPIDSPRAP